MHNEQIYTPSKVVNFILDNVGFNNRYGIDGKHIIDNSCGNGNFLVEIVKRIFQFISNVDKEYLETSVHGIEIDEYAYNETINRLNKIATEHNISNVKWDVRNSDALRTTDFDNSMNYVVGNPPYCNVHHMSKKNYDLLKNDVILRELPAKTAVYSGFYIIRNGMLQNRKEMKLLYQQVDDALKTNLFANYVKSIGKSKNGGYYTFSTKDLEQFLNYFYSI